MLELELKRLVEKKNMYPFHMPGHKRMELERFPNPYAIDITEIEDFDNLHHPQGVLLEEQERAARLYGSKQSYLLVNGSSCGILAAISAATRRGGKILVARNCHKSVYHAIELRQLTPVYLYPVAASHGLQGLIRPGDVEKKLVENPDIQAVVITSPTYDGVVSDVWRIAGEAHRKGVPLIVDEAHGAHFGFHPAFPENATRLDADIVIMSVHKTLPSFTQTALLHLCSDRIRAEEVQRFLAIYETSSPSYLLMAGMSRCMRMLSLSENWDKFAAYAKRLKRFRDETAGLRRFHVIAPEDFRKSDAFAFDIGKIIIDTEDSGVTGQQLKKALLEQYNLQMEMACCNYVLAMTSFMDGQRAFSRLRDALIELDAKAEQEDGWGERLDPADMYREQEKCMEVYEATEAEHELVPFEEAMGRICADYVYLYPPGIPLLVPGECICEWTMLDIQECRQKGLDVEGLTDDNEIKVVKAS